MASNIARDRYDRIKRYTGVFLATLAILLALAVGGLEAFAETSWVKHHIGLGQALRVSLAVVAAFEGIRRIWLRVQRHMRHKSQIDVQTALIGLMVAVHSVTSIPVQDLGASVFKIRRDWWQLWLYPNLYRIHRLRLTGPQASAVNWTKGKGAIGKCWDSGRAEHCHWYPIATHWGKSDLTEHLWEKINASQRWGFDREEFQTMVRKYAEILAVPVVHPTAGTVQGILSIDLSMGSSSASSAPKLAGSQVEQIATEAARTVASTAP